MSAQHQRCVVCNRTLRAAKSTIIAIKSRQQEERIKAGYLKRYKHSITGSILDQKLHRSCYRSIIRNVSTSNSFSLLQSSDRTNSSHQNSDGKLSSALSDQRQINEQSDNLESDFPEDRRLLSCGECTSGCSRCNCGVNQVPCTIYCKCRHDCCKNRSTTKNVNTTLTTMTLPSDDDTIVKDVLADDDDNVDGPCSSSSDVNTFASDNQVSLHDSTQVDVVFQRSNSNHRRLSRSAAVCHVELDHDYCLSSVERDEQTLLIKRQRNHSHFDSVSSASSGSTSPRPKRRFLEHFRMSNSQKS